MTAPAPMPYDSQFHDTAQGAIAFLRADSTHDLTRATAIPDPEVAGVWLVDLHVPDPADHDAVEVIVYLKGYPDPWGDLRAHNDFETLWGAP